MLSRPPLSPALLLAALLAAGAPLRADEPAPPPAAPPVVFSRPTTFTTLTVGKTIFHDVSIRSQDTRSVFFTHRDGMGSARLRDLAPEVQARLGFDPLTAPPEPTPPPLPAAAPPRELLPERIISANQRLEKLANSFGAAPRFAPRISLQSDFDRLSLGVKEQGRRPSCAVYALVTALEFQYFQLHGRAEDFSEEYLIWATRRRLGLNGREGLAPRDASGEFAADTGFALLSVAQALSVYGIALEREMPARAQLTDDPSAAPATALIDLSRQRRGIFIGQIPGETNGATLRNLVHVLNAGMPVPSGVRWTNDAQSRAGLLDRQPPMGDAAHAVTFVGYECPSGRPEDAVFLFKNSYGPRWGQNGYGRATWHYLEKNLIDAYVLEVRTPAISSIVGGGAGAGF